LYTSITISGRTYFPTAAFDMDSFCTTVEALAREGGCLDLETIEGRTVVGVPPGTAIFVQYHSREPDPIAPLPQASIADL
jgi:hypothetical protein